MFLFHVVVGLACLYVLLRHVRHLAWPRWAKIAFAVLLVIGSQHHLYARIAFGSMFVPEFPQPIVVAVNVAFGVIFFLLWFQLAYDLIGLLLRWVILRRKVHGPVVLRTVMSFAAIALACFGVAQSMRVPDVKEMDVTIRDLPDGFDGYRLVQLTDLHISKLYERPWVAEVVAKTNALEPDLIVITGDLIDGELPLRYDDVQPLHELKAPDGVITIPGNHEYYFGYENWMNHYGGLNMLTLENAHIVLERGRDQLTIAGVTDLRADRTNRPEPDVAKALEGSPENAPVILLDHQPKMARDAEPLGVDLQLSGHTHGGMVAIFDNIVALLNGGFVSGMYDIGDMQLYVNNGTAQWPGFAIRVGVPAELTVITLRKG
ncbi:metallophosphoesterase [Thalassospira sp.]|uniref:metallophosphoesterase n=1 Tax=Thalassospira sp. TaxID=1912094 RepID=UPI000C35F14E|nr:metallophosphoesterase [Thalassospira sp.]MBC07888.1 metallophosphoesterase [Thalassospira sp.]